MLRHQHGSKRVLKGLVVFVRVRGSCVDQRNRISVTGLPTREPACQSDLWGWALSPIASIVFIVQSPLL